MCAEKTEEQDDLLQNLILTVQLQIGCGFRMGGSLSFSTLITRTLLPSVLSMGNLYQEFSLSNGVAFSMYGFFNDGEKRSLTD